MHSIINAGNRKIPESPRWSNLLHTAPMAAAALSL